MSLHPVAAADRDRRQLLRNYPKLFDAAVSRLLNSPNPEERGLVFLGFAREGGYPVFMPAEDLVRHAEILGDPGSGKTARCLAPLMAQLIGGGETSVVIADLKGDMGLFQNAKTEAELAGLPLKWLTTRIGWSSYIWNFFKEPFLARMSWEQIAQTIIAAAGLDHAEIYGGGHFTAAMRMFLVNILERYGESIHSFADLYRYCSDSNAYKGLGNREDPKDARHFINVLRMLAGPLSLNATAADLPAQSSTLLHAMSVEELLFERAVYYLWLPATVDSNQATCLTRLFLFAQTAAASLYQLERPTSTIINFIDEAQLIATQGLPLILNQARSLKIGCILAHQSLDQLALSSDNDLSQIVLSSTAFKQVFRASDLKTRDYLVKTAGEAVYHRLQWEQAAPLKNGQVREPSLTPLEATRTDPWTGNPVVQVAEEIRSRLEPNTIMEVSAAPDLSLVSFTEDHGPVQYNAAWTTLVSGFHIDEATYKRRMATPWPPADEAGGAILVPRNWKPGPLPPTPAPAPAPTSDLQERVQQALKSLRRQQS